MPPPKDGKKDSNTYPPLGHVRPPGRPVTLGTDCSGMEAPRWALRKLGYEVDQHWASDIDPHSYETVARQDASMHPRVFYRDLTKRDHRELPHVDVYVAGFPCQPLSLLGKRLAYDDPRGQVFFGVARTIRATRPKVFVLENVANLVQTDAFFQPFRAEMKRIVPDYEISVSILNSADFGHAQVRRRAYILGVRRDQIRNAVTLWPPVVRPTPSILPALDPASVDPDRRAPPGKSVARKIARMEERIRRAGGDPAREPWVFSTGESEDFMRAKMGVAPTLVASHSHDMWVTSLGRYLTPREVSTIQGFPRSFRPHPSASVAFHQVGNSMSVNVVAAIIEEGLYRIGRSNRPEAKADGAAAATRKACMGTGPRT